MRNLLQPMSALAMAVLMLAGCENLPPTDLATEVIIPKPVSVVSGGSTFEIAATTPILVDGNDEALLDAAAFLAAEIGNGLELEVGATDSSPAEGIYLTASANDEELGVEGYELHITERLVTLKGNTPEGVFRGIQTIRQLLDGNAKPYLSTGTVRDYPRMGYRGSMLDVARHFFGVEDVKRYLDFLTYYKMNAFHMHLTDDQGWRIEIKAWPRLTEVGGSTQVGGEGGGFYTQEQYQEIVAYAAERYITVVPEIDMPGHTNAALASYPALNCDGQARDLYEGIEVGFSSLCVDKELTYEFVDEVIEELAAMTPGPYIHIGGDESHATEKEDYLLFVNRVADIVDSHGKTMVGWDETAQAELNEGAVVQLWHSPEFAKMAIEKGAKLIMSPADRTYLDMQYDSTSRIGLHWAAYIEVDDGYTWDPATVVEGIGEEDIIGIEAPLWTETVETMEDIEYLVFPRLPGYAEIGWTPQNQRSWEEYAQRLKAHGPVMKAMGIDYYPSEKVWEAME